MTVLIKGMKMPENCFYCSMSHFEGKRLFCNRLHDEVPRRKVDPDCPLVELPPHGRLIDADALKRMDFTKVVKKDGETYVPFMEVAEAVFNAPTIIEAEVEE